MKKRVWGEAIDAPMAIILVFAMVMMTLFPGGTLATTAMAEELAGSSVGQAGQSSTGDNSAAKTSDSSSAGGSSSASSGAATGTPKKAPMMAAVPPRGDEAFTIVVGDAIVDTADTLADAVANAATHLATSDVTIQMNKDFDVSATVTIAGNQDHVLTITGLDNNGNTHKIKRAANVTLLNVTSGKVNFDHIYFDGNGTSLTGEIYGSSMLAKLGDGATVCVSDSSMHMFRFSTNMTTESRRAGLFWQSKNSSLTMRNVEATSNWGGWGVVADLTDTNATFLAEDCNFSDNIVSNGMITCEKGSCTVTLRRVTAERNYCTQGGINNYTHGTVLASMGGNNTWVLENCTMSHNITQNRGAVFCSIEAGDKLVQATGCTFEDNRAFVNNGGVMYLISPGKIDNCKFIKNSMQTVGVSVSQDADGKNVFNLTEKNEYHWGAGILFETASGLEVRNSIFTENKATGGSAILVQKGGNTITISGCEFTGNNASANGGPAIYLEGNFKSLDIKDGSRFEGNKAEGGSGYGGAVYCNSAAGTLTVDGATFINNTTASYGGAIYCKGSVTINGTTFKKNAATNDGGAVYCENAISIKGKSIFDENEASQNGGAVYKYSTTGTMEIDDSSFTKNKAKQGGAVHTTVATTIANKASFTENEATSDYGGAVYTTSNNSLDVSDASFSGNIAKDSGGAIYNADGSASKVFNVTRCQFNDNAANGTRTGYKEGSGGGAVYFHYCTAVIKDNAFEGNSATAWGGAVFTSARFGGGSTYTLTGENTFVDNRAAYGAAFHNGDGGTKIMGKIIATDNKSTGPGPLSCYGTGNNFDQPRNDGDIDVHFGGDIAAGSALYVSDWFERPDDTLVVDKRSYGGVGDNQIQGLWHVRSDQYQDMYLYARNNMAYWTKVRPTLTYELNGGASGPAQYSGYMGQFVGAKDDGTEYEQPLAGVNPNGTSKNDDTVTHDTATGTDGKQHKVLFIGWTKNATTTSDTKSVAGAEVLTRNDRAPKLEIRVGQLGELVGTAATANDTKLYAVWGIDEDNNGVADVFESDKLAAVEYNANGGKDAPLTQIVHKGTSTQLFGQENTSHEKIDGHDVYFLGWSLNSLNSGSGPKVLTKDDKQLMNDNRIAEVNVTGDTTVFALWGIDADDSGKADVTETYNKLVYNTNGGNKEVPDTRDVLAGAKVSDLDPGTMMTHNVEGDDDVLFMGWTAEPSDVYIDRNNADLTRTGTDPRYLLIKDVTVDKDPTNVYALWGLDINGNGVPDGSEQDGPYVLTYDANGGNNGVPSSLEKLIPGDTIGTNGVTNAGTKDTNPNWKKVYKELNHGLLDDGTKMSHNAYATDGVYKGKDVVFIGWSQKQDNTIYTYDDAEPTVLTDVTIEKANVTLYAVWGVDANGDGVADVLQKGDLSRLSYNTNGGDLLPKPIDEIVKRGDQIVLNAADTPTTRPVHDPASGVPVVFAGWSEQQDTKIYTRMDNAPALITKLIVPSAATSTVYAVWGVDSNNDGIADVLQKGDFHTLKYDVNKGIGGGPVDEGQKLKGDIVTLSTAVPLHGDYADGHQVLLVGWTENNYVSASDPAGKEVLTRTDTLPTLVKQVTMPDDDKTIYAVWGVDANDDGTPDILQKDSLRTLTYDANGGTTTLTTLVNLLGGDKIALDVDPAKTMHAQAKGVDGQDHNVVLFGWSKDKPEAKDKSEVFTKDDVEPATVSNPYTMVDDDVTLYAAWGIDEDGDGTADVTQASDLAKLTYDTNGGDATKPADKIVKKNAETELDKATVPTHGQQDGKDVLFVGWSTTQEMDVLTKDSADPTVATKVTITADPTTAYAVWGIDEDGNGTPDVLEKGNLVELNYDANGGTGANLPATKVVQKNALGVALESGAAMTHAKSGEKAVVFAGWTKDTPISKILTTNDTADAAKFVTSVDFTGTDVIACAAWGIDSNGNGIADVNETNKFTLSYNKTSGEPNVPASVKVVDQEQVTLDSGVGTMTHAKVDGKTVVFIGWSKTSTDKIFTTNDADELASLHITGPITITGNTEVYALWGYNSNPGTQTVADVLVTPKLGLNYSANGGNSAAPAQVKVVENEQVVLDGGATMTHVKKDGKDVVFVGWSTKQYAAPLTVNDKAELANVIKTLTIPAGGATVYAVWGYNSDGQGKADVLEDSLSLAFKTGTSQQPAEIAPLANGEVVPASLFPTKAGADDLVHNDYMGKHVMLYGWSNDDHTAEVFGKSAKAQDMQAMRLSEKTMAGNAVLHAIWATDSDNDGTPDFEETANLTLTYDANGGQGAPAAASSLIEGEDVTLDAATTPTHDATASGKKVIFLGWVAQDKNPGKVLAKGDAAAAPADADYLSKVTMPGTNMSVYAVWAVDSNADGTPDFKETDNFTLTYDAKGGQDAPAAVGGLIEGEDVTLAGKGNISHAQQGGKSVAFVGWTENSTVKEVLGKGDKSEVPTLVSTKTMPKANVTVYAVWAVDSNGNGTPDYDEAANLTLKFDVADGKDAPADKTGLIQGEDVDLNKVSAPTHDATANGKRVIFLGWVAQDKNPGKVIAKGDANLAPADADYLSMVTMPAADTTVYAVWAVDSNANGTPDFKETADFKLVYDANGGDRGTLKDVENLIDGEDVELDAGTTLTHDATANGKAIIFVGWSATQVADALAKGDATKKPADTAKGGIVTINNADATRHAVWAVDSDNDGTPDFEEAADPALNFALTYDATTGKSAPASENGLLNGEDVTVAAKGSMYHDDAASKHVMFVGWTFDANYDGAPLTKDDGAAKKPQLVAPGDTLTMGAANRVLRAVWAINSAGDDTTPDYEATRHTFTYDNEGGSNAFAPVQGLVKGDVVTLVAATEPKHADDSNMAVKFVGWSETPQSGTIHYADASDLVGTSSIPTDLLTTWTMEDADKTVYAVWAYPISEQKRVAKEAIDAEATKVSDEIDADVTLTNEQKTAQKAAVKKAADEAKANIDKATTAQGVSDAKDAGVAEIDKQHVAGKSLDDQKADAIKELEAKAAETNKAIDDDATLTADEKAQQKANVAAELEAAKKAVNDATDAQGVLDAKSAGLTDIAAQHVAGASLDDQKKAAKAAIDDELAKVIEAIENDKTLTSDQKLQQQADAEQAAENAKTAIDNAADADGINAARDTGVADVDGKHVAGDSLSKQRLDAINALKAEAAKINGEIDADATLTAEQKAQQKANVAAELEAAIAKVKAATDADGINAARDAGIVSIDAQHKAGASIEKQRAAAIEALKKEAAKVSDDIDADTTLTADEKAQQKADVAAALQTAIDAVNAANSADDINSALSDGIADIDAKHVGGTDLDKQKAAAIAELEAKAKETNKAIDGDATLTDAEKAAQKAKVADELKKAADAVNAATSADDVNAARDAGLTDIAAQHKAGKSLDDQKADAIKELETKAAETTKAIDDDATLTADEKAQQKANVAAELEAAKKAVNDATDAQGVLDAKSAGLTDVAAQHVPGTSLDDQKKAAIAELEAKAAETSKAIDDDVTLTADEKAAQKAKVADELKKATDAVNAAADADGVNAAKGAGLSDIAAQHVAGTPLADQKKAAIAELEAKAAETNKAIDDDVTLTDAEKADQKAKVADALKAAVDNVKNAADADGVNAAKDAGLSDIAAQHVAGTPLADQKKAAIAELEAKAAETSKAIDDDATLTADEKAQQKANVAAELEAAKKAVNDATNAQGVVDAKDSGLVAIDAQHVEGKSLDDQKKAAVAELEAKAAETNKAIDDDVTLTADEKAAQKAKVADELKKATDAVNAAASADAINSAKDAGLSDIAAQHVGGTSLDKQKADAIAELEAKAAETNKAIDDDPTLSAAEKAQQKANVASELKKASDNVNAATDADGVNAAKDAGLADIAAQHVAGTSLDDQKKAAKDAIDAEAAKIKAAIEADVTLSTEEKAQQKANVDKQANIAKSAIDAADDADGINAARDAGIKAIDDQHVSNKPLDEQKADAKKAIDDEAAKIKAAIDADPTLTTEERDAQKAKVDADATKAKENIDKASDAQGVRDARDAGIADIDNDHTTGTSLDAQRDAAIQALKAEAAKIAADIENDPTLTDDQKIQQKADVANELSKAIDAVKAAANADDINAARDAGIKAIDAAYKTGVALDQQKADAIAELRKKAAETNALIDADKSLTQDEKDAQRANVQAELKAAIQNVKDATNADALNDAVEAGKTDIAKQYKPGAKTVDQQKNDAKKAIDAEAAKVKAQIDADTSLTDAEKATQKAAVDSDAQAAKDAIDAADNADAIIKARDNGIIEIDADYEPGVPLENQKAAAIAELRRKAAETNALIEGDSTLTNAEKAAQKAAVADELNKAIGAVNAATGADDVNAAKDAGLKAIADQYKPGASLADQRQAAKDAIDAEAAKIKAAIDADVALTSEQKQAQKDAVDADAKAAKDAIDAAANAQEIKNALEDGIIAIDADYLPGTSLDDQKAAAKKAIDDEAAKVKAAIDADASLTSDEKASQKAKVEADAKSAKAAIDAATDSDGINAARDAGIAAIDADYAPGTPLMDQKSDAKKAIDAEAAKIKAQIDADPTLTTEEKADQKARVDAEATKAKTAIDVATNADEVNAARDAGITAIDVQHVSNDLDKRKADAIAELEAKAAETSKAIDDDATLTADEKAAQKQAVADELKKATDAVNAAADADGVNAARDAGVADIAKQHVSGTDLAEQKKAAVAELEAKAAETTKAIDDDPTLTADEKAAQKQAVADELKKATDAVNGATDADGVNAAKDAGLKAIADQHVGGTALDQQKSDAIKALEAKAAETSKAIDDDPTLTADEKAEQKAKVADELKKATDAVNAAADADGVNAAKDAGLADIAAQHVGGTALDQQKSDAIKALEAKAAETSKAIDEDQTLTADEKAAQKAAVADELKKATDAVSAATDADGVNAAKDAGLEAIADQHKPGTSLDDQKSDAIKALEAKAAETSKAIDDDATLTDAEKAAQKAAVADELKKAADAVSAATDADGVNAAKDAGLEAISDQHKPGTSLDDQKSDAIKALEAKAAETSKAIDDDPTLTTEEKEAQKAKVAEELRAAVQNVKDATDADGVNAARDAGLVDIAAQHVPGTDLDKQKSDAIKALEAKAAETSKAIDDDTTLTDAEKAAQKANVADALKKAKDSVNAAADADGVNAARDAGLADIAAQHVGGTDLDKQKSDAIAELQRKAAETSKAIDDDTTLTNAEKAAQKAAVAAELKKATDAVNAAADADGVNAAKDAGLAAIEACHVGGTALDEQKQAAKDAIDAEAAKVKAQIDADPALTSEQRQAQRDAVDADAKAAKDAIDAAADAQGVKEALEAGIIAIDADYLPSPASLDDQKKAAIAELEAKAAETTKAIDDDVTLTASEKEAQKAAVADELKKAKDAVSAATDADGVNAARDAGLADIAAQHKPGASLDDQKKAAIDELEAKAKETTKAIDEDQTLTAEEKAAQKANVADALKKATDAVNAAADADGVNAAKDAGLADIAAQHVPNDLDELRRLAMGAVDLETVKIVDAIKADASLTDAEKEEQIAKAEADAKAAKEAIAKAQSADAIFSARDKGIDAVDVDHQSGDFDKVKRDAKSAIDAEAARVKAQIDDDPYLSDAEKAAQKAGVDAEATKAKEAIDAATSVEAVLTARDDGIAAIDAQYVAGQRPSYQPTYDQSYTGYQPVATRSYGRIAQTNDEAIATTVLAAIAAGGVILIVLAVFRRKRDGEDK